MHKHQFSAGKMVASLTFGILAVLTLADTSEVGALTFQSLDRLKWGQHTTVVDSILATESLQSGFDSLGIRRYADSLGGFSCEVIPVADGEVVDALLIRFHTLHMREGEAGYTYDLLVSELSAKYGKPAEFRRTGYSRTLEGIMRRHAIWEDSTDQVLLILDRDSKFAPLLDLLIARSSAGLKGSTKEESPKSEKTGLVSWLFGVSPAIQPSHLMHPPAQLKQVDAGFDTVGVTMPSLVWEEKPSYPEAAIYGRGEGIVWIRALIDEDGTVQAVRLVKASDTGFDFESTSIKSAFGNRYNPATRNGVPFSIWVTYPIEFKIR